MAARERQHHRPHLDHRRRRGRQRLGGGHAAADEGAPLRRQRRVRQRAGYSRDVRVSAAADSFTVEAWVKYREVVARAPADGTIIAKASPGSGASRFPFTLGNMSGTGQPGRLRFSMSDSTTTVSVSTARSDLNDNAWHHVACVHDAAEDSLSYLRRRCPRRQRARLRVSATSQMPSHSRSARDPPRARGSTASSTRCVSGASRAAHREIQATMAKPLAGDEERSRRRTGRSVGRTVTGRKHPGVITDLAS